MSRVDEYGYIPGAVEAFTACGSLESIPIGGSGIGRGVVALSMDAVIVDLVVVHVGP